jgi:hypothetical protein
MPKQHSTRTRGPQELSFVLARSVCCIFHDAVHDWLGGSPVHFADVRSHVEQMLRDEFLPVEERIRNEFRNAWSNELQAEFKLDGGR